MESPRKCLVEEQMAYYSCSHHRPVEVGSCILSCFAKKETQRGEAICLDHTASQRWGQGSRSRLLTFTSLSSIHSGDGWGLGERWLNPQRGSTRDSGFSSSRGQSWSFDAYQDGLSAQSSLGTEPVGWLGGILQMSLGTKKPGREGYGPQIQKCNTVRARSLVLSEHPPWAQPGAGGVCPGGAQPPLLHAVSFQNVDLTLFVLCLQLFRDPLGLALKTLALACVALKLSHLLTCWCLARVPPAHFKLCVRSLLDLQCLSQHLESSDAQWMGEWRWLQLPL